MIWPDVLDAIYKIVLAAACSGIGVYVRWAVKHSRETQEAVQAELAGKDESEPSIRQMIDKQSREVENYGRLLGTTASSLDDHRRESAIRLDSIHKDVVGLDARLQTLDLRVMGMERTVTQHHDRVTNLEAAMFRDRRPTLKSLSKNKG